MKHTEEYLKIRAKAHRKIIILVLLIWAACFFPLVFILFVNPNNIIDGVLMSLLFLFITLPSGIHALCSPWQSLHYNDLDEIDRMKRR